MQKNRFHTLCPDLRIIGLAFCLFAGTEFYAQNPSSGSRFFHLNADKGLSHSHVQTMAKDRYGFMWFGTQNGLDKYDGYKFTVYRNNPKDANSILFNDIRYVYEDKRGDLWIGGHYHGLLRYNRKLDRFIPVPDSSVGGSLTSNASVNVIYEDSRNNFWICTFSGLTLLDRNTRKFTHFVHDARDSTSISSNQVLAIYEDSQKNLWLGTRDGGLNLFDRDTKKFKSFKHNSGDPYSISSNNVTTITEDKLGQLWIGTQGGGLNLLDKKTGRFTSFKQSPGGLCHNSIFAVGRDKDGHIWLGTEGGLNKLNPLTKQFEVYKNTPGDNSTLTHNSVKSILVDDEEIVWIGTFLGGISMLNKNLFYFEHRKSEVFNQNSLSNNAVTSFLEDASGNVWIGTDGGGVDVWNKSANSFINYRYKPENKSGLKDNAVLALLKDRDGDIWIGTYGGGLHRFHPKTKTFSYITAGKGAKNLSSNAVFALLQDRQGNIWIGTNNGGLNVLDKKTGLITKYRYDPNNSRKGDPCNNDIRSLFEDSEGNIWAGTYGAGANVFNPHTKTFTCYNKITSNISSDIVYCFTEDKHKNLWIGTLGGGLNLFDRKTKTFIDYRKEGLESEVVNAISEDAHGHLWLSTNNGVSRFDPGQKLFRHYDVSNGLQGNEFQRNAALRLSTGEILFGGNNGFNIFSPDVIYENKHVPPVVFTDFQLFNKPVIPGEKDAPVQSHISEAKEIMLSHNQSVFTIGFAALNFTMPEKNQYAYKLEGFDKDWNYVGTSRTATYTNLDPGEYLFRVKASNNDGIWNEKGTAIKIIIRPPYWKTWWFRILVAVLASGAIFSFYRIRISAIKRQKLLLEKEVQERTAEVQRQSDKLQLQSEKLQATVTELSVQKEEAEQLRLAAEEANRAKSVFLATMSHEIRTPMNGVIGTASLLAETPLSEEQRRYAEIIQKSGESLLTVINDILDFSKIESGKTELDHHCFDLHTCVEEVLDIFASKTNEAAIDLLYHIEADVPGQVISDSTRLKQVLINLVGNAIKFTKKGEVFIGVKQGAKKQNEIELLFEVRDTGIGIPQEKQAQLFEAFMQVDSSTTRKYGGTGLGLAISKRLVELLNGNIRVVSAEGKGTSFFFSIRATVPDAAPVLSLPYALQALEGRRILVVDDKETSLSLLQKQLTAWKFHVTTAACGSEALNLLANHDFHLVITGVQMPDMDGCMLAREIKKKYNTPLVLLGWGGAEKKEDCPELFAAVLPKPVKQKNLEAALAAALKKTPQPEAGKKSNILSTEFARKFPLSILVAEDNPVNQTVIGLTLKKLGYEAQMVANGLQALQALEEKSYQAVLMDVQMPQMDGLEATRNIRKQHTAQPVIIALTANALQDDKEQCLEAGMNDYISKPIELAKLKEVLAKWALVVNGTRS